MSVVAVILLVLGLFALLGLVAWGVVLQAQFQTSYAAKFEAPRTGAAAPSVAVPRELVGASA